jgi:hypothetical protein
MAVNKGGAEVTIGPTRRGRDSVPLTLKLAAWCYGELVDLTIEHLKLADREGGAPTIAAPCCVPSC